MTQSDGDGSRPTPAPDGASLEITREALLDGSLHRAIARGRPDMQLLSESERRASLEAILASRPSGSRDGAWLFCYGSLIWNPTIVYDDRRVATVRDWHRAFCLSTAAGRGSRARPGLVLALDAGGSCTGVALHIPEALLAAELAVVWAREMIAGSYVPMWLELHDAEGAVFGHGIGFTIDPGHPSYVGGLPVEERVRRLATAAGELGTSAEYLFRTRDGLQSFGIHDPAIEHLADRVAGWEGEGGTSPAAT